MKSILFIYTLYVLVVFFGSLKDFNNMAITPKEIYECTNFNMFACILIFLGGIIINPLFYITHFLYWIFHVGRRK